MTAVSMNRLFINKHPVVQVYCAGKINDKS